MRSVKAVYEQTQSFPKKELYGLTQGHLNQMGRAAISIASNISEGVARNGDKEFIHFLHVALGSAAEIQTQLTIAEKLSFITKDHFYNG